MIHTLNFHKIFSSILATSVNVIDETFSVTAVLCFVVVVVDVVVCYLVVYHATLVLYEFLPTGS